MLGVTINAMPEHSAEDAAATTALRLAREAISGILRPLLAARFLTPLLHDLKLDDDDRFIPLCGVDSEIDCAPLEDRHRRYWDAKALEREDSQSAQYERRVKDIVLAACAALITQLEAKRDA